MSVGEKRRNERKFAASLVEAMFVDIVDKLDGIEAKNFASNDETDCCSAIECAEGAATSNTEPDGSVTGEDTELAWVAPPAVAQPEGPRSTVGDEGTTTTLVLFPDVHRWRELFKREPKSIKHPHKARPMDKPPARDSGWMR